MVLSSEGSGVRTSVVDKGLGIPEDAKDRIFEKFYRVEDDDRREIGGTGLGLAICNEVVRAHGGRVGFSSEFRRGSTFYFTLPRRITEPQVEVLSTDEHLSLQGNRGNLLIVEDEESMVKLIRELLKDEDLTVHDVASGEEALVLIREQLYQLIILDIALKGQLTGWDVLRELKSHRKTADIPIIISSIYENKGNANMEDIADYLVKPFEPEQLLKVVRKALSGKLNSKMMVNRDEDLEELITQILAKVGIAVEEVDYCGNALIITLEGEVGCKDER